MSEQDQYAKRVQDLAKMVASCVSRWDVVFDPATVTDDPGRKITTALRQATSKALKFEFTNVYADDHSWSGGSLRGVSHRRVLEISEDPYAVDSDIYGVVAIAQAGTQGVVIPLVTDVDVSSSEAALLMIECDILSHIDGDLVGQVLGSDEFDLKVAAGNWKTLGRIIDQSVLTLADAIWLRKSAAWDLVRGSLSGLPCPPLPLMTDNEFASRYFRSMRFSAIEIASSQEMLRAVSQKDHEFLTPKWTSWFETLVENLNLIGPPKPFEGLSVIMAFSYEEVTAEDPLKWRAISVHNMCVACGLDPVAAGVLVELARTDPIQFHDLLPGQVSRYSPLGVLVIPDVELARYRVSLMGRRSVAYDRLAAATRLEESEAA